MKQRACSQSGFTLLEVMIAVAIMTVAFGAILTSQSGSIAQTIKTKEYNLGGWLAEKIMVESEHLLEGKPFGEIDKMKTEKFAAPYDRFTWKREVRELKFPDLTKAEKEGEGILESARVMGKVITKYLSNSVREMVITVSWPVGSDEAHLTLTTYLIDLNAEFNFAI